MFLEVLTLLLNSEESEPLGNKAGCLVLLIFFLLFVFMLWGVFFWDSADKGKRIIEFWSDVF